MSRRLPARTARWLARARRAGLDEASMGASYGEAFLASTKEETL